MKIFIVSANLFNYPQSIRNAFERLGHTVELYCFVDNTYRSFWGKSYITLVNFYNNALMHNGRLYMSLKSVRDRESAIIVNKMKNFQPDIFLSFAAYNITKEALEQIDCPKIIWVYDSIKRILPLQKTIPMYDLRFFFEGTDILWLGLNDKKSFFLPLCADADDYFPVENRDVKENEIDIFFVGALSKKRINFFKRIHKDFPDANIKVYGQYLKKYQFIKKHKYKKTWEKEVFMNETILPEKVNELYSRTKICINLLHEQSKKGINMRFFEIMAAKVFQLVESNEYIEKFWSEDVISFNTEEEAIDKLKYYLINDTKRKEMAERGYQRTMSHELFYHRAKEILEVARGEGVIKM